MSKTKELRELIDKVKNDISVQIDTIVEWNLDNSDYLQELYRISKENGEEFNDLFQDYVNYIKLISFEELLGEFKNTK
tara:strand:+ start:45 stop:278 length:234 start_codon:yes stop_codon:yes gene_type:complete